MATTAKHPVELGDTQITLLIPLLGRAEETRKASGLIRDERAVAIVESLDYDFSKWVGGPSLPASVFRTRMYDDIVAQFIQQFPSGTVVEIGAGLNGRFERVDNGLIHWIDLDLPDVIELRRKYYTDSERQQMLAASFLDSHWHQTVLKAPAPYCFVAEASIIYLDKDRVEPAIRRLAEAFPGSWLVTDTTDQDMVDQQASHDAMKHLPRSSWFRWACDSPAELENLGMKLVSSQSFLDADRQLINLMPFKIRMIARWAPWLMRKAVAGYRINRFELDA